MVFSSLAEEYTHTISLMENPFCIVEVLINNDLQPAKLHLIEANNSFKNFFGTQPDLHYFDASKLMQAAQSNEPSTIEEYIASIKKWFNINIIPLKKDNRQLLSLIFHEITKTKEAEETLRTSEIRFAAFFAEAHVGLCEVSLTGIFLKVNPTLCQMLNQPAANLVGKSVGQITYHEDLPRSLKLLERVIQQGIPASLDKRLVTAENKTVWVNSRVSLLQANNGDPARFLIVINDVTERKLAENALRNSEKRFRTLTDAVPQIIWTNERHGKATYFNRRWYEYSGLTESASKGPGWQVIVHPDDGPASVELWQTALAKGEIFDTEYRLRRADGVYRWHIGRNVPLYDEAGHVTGWFGSATDIDDLKTAEKWVRESREQLRVTLESATDYAIITMDTNGLIVGWSKGAALSFGYTEEEAIGQHSRLIYTFEDRETKVPEKEIIAAVEKGMALDERWHMRKDGSKFFMSGVMRPIYNPHLSGFVKLGRDRTEQKLIEEQKDEFIGIASHELKTPVTSMKILSELLQEQFELEKNEQAVTMMRQLNNQVDRLTNLIRDLLDTTKIVEGRLPMNPEIFAIDQFIQAHAKELQLLSPNHRFVLDLQAGVNVTADKERIGQVLTNLITNAIKYSAPGTTITISSQQTDDGIKVSVADQGIGIPADVQSRIFERFFRVSSEKMKTYAGMGLGLYISSEIIARHRGTISVQSREDEGSEFTFTLPIDYTVK